jgi:DNA-directed RNA polymerase specialized sigma24 family protein
VEPPRSREEIEKAIGSLSPADSVRLRKVARACSRGGALDLEDLLQEAFTRAIDGSRNCPRNVDVVRFLAEVIRSIASDTFKVMRRQPDFHAVPIINDDGSPIDVPDRALGPEDRLAGLAEAKRISTAILDLFTGDPVAEIMVIGIIDGMEGEELREITELDATAFASKRRYIRRRITDAFPHGWKR